MSSFVLTKDELDALYGLPDQDFRMYVLMRSWMDFRTGIVGGGKGPRICYSRFREYMELVLERGSTAAPVRRTNDALRASVARLERKHLISRVLRPGDSGFEFSYRLKLALLRPFEEPRMSPTGQPRMSAMGDCYGNHDVTSNGYDDEPLGESPDEPQPSVYLKDIDISRACARESELAAAASKLGVSGDIPGWVAAGVTPAFLKLAVLRSREHIQPPRRIPASYLAQVLETVLEGQERPVRPTAKPAARQDRPARPGNRWVKVAPDCAFDGLPPVSGNMPPEAAGGGDDWIE